jgi:hypothetical protein
MSGQIDFSKEQLPEEVYVCRNFNEALSIWDEPKTPVIK